MKRINITLGILSAVTTFGLVKADSLRIPAQYAFDGTTCRAIVDVECGVAGPNACTVKIAGTNYPASSNPTCTIVVTTNLTVPILTSWE